MAVARRQEIWKRGKKKIRDLGDEGFELEFSAILKRLISKRPKIGFNDIVANVYIYIYVDIIINKF